MNPAVVQAAYARVMGANGPSAARTVQLVRMGDSNTYLVQATVTDFVPIDLAGANEQGKRTAVVLASSVIASGFPLPFIPKQDRLKWNLGGTTKTNVITRVDDATLGPQDVLSGYKLDLDGA